MGQRMFGTRNTIFIEEGFHPGFVPEILRGLGIHPRDSEGKAGFRHGDLELFGGAKDPMYWAGDLL